MLATALTLYLQMLMSVIILIHVALMLSVPTLLLVASPVPVTRATVDMDSTVLVSYHWAQVLSEYVN